MSQNLLHAPRSGQNRPHVGVTEVTAYIKDDSLTALLVNITNVKAVTHVSSSPSASTFEGPYAV